MYKLKGLQLKTTRGAIKKGSMNALNAENYSVVVTCGWIQIIRMI